MTKLQCKIEADKRVLELEVEPTDGWFVSLSPGWRMADDPQPTHSFGEDTLSLVWQQVRRAVPCQCAQCAAEQRAAA